MSPGSPTSHSELGLESLYPHSKLTYNKPILTYIRTLGIPRFYLALLLAAMAIGQLFSFSVFVDILADYQVAFISSLVLAVLILGLEIIGAVGLLTPRKSFSEAGKFAALLVAVLWTVLALQALLRGIDIANCGRFGAYLGQPLTWWVMLQDAIFVALATFVFFKKS